MDLYIFIFIYLSFCFGVWRVLLSWVGRSTSLMVSQSIELKPSSEHSPMLCDGSIWSRESGFGSIKN